MGNYYKRSEILNNQFIQIPKALFKNPNYPKLSSHAKLLYGALLDRLQLSQRSEWYDAEGYVFIIYTREQAMDLLGVTKPTITKIFKELNDVELIREKTQGVNKANLIYIGHIKTEGLKAAPEFNAAPAEELDPINGKNGKSETVANTRGLNNLTMEVKKVNPINTNNNKTNNNSNKEKPLFEAQGAAPMENENLFKIPEEDKAADEITGLENKLKSINKNKKRLEAAKLKIRLAELKDDWGEVGPRDFSYYYAKVLYAEHYKKPMEDFSHYFPGSIKKFIEAYKIPNDLVIEVFKRLLKIYDIKYKNDKNPTMGEQFFSLNWILKNAVPNVLADIKRDQREQREEPTFKKIEADNKNTPDYF